MHQRIEGIFNMHACQNNEETIRNVNPEDIMIANGYQIEVFAQGLDSPISMQFTQDGDMIIAESGYTSGNPRVLRLVNGSFEVIADNFNVPITGMLYWNDLIYISHRGYVSIVNSEGIKQNIISGLPSNGDYSNSRVVIGPDNKLYFGQGTTTNSGVVGLDNDWVFNNPLDCDYPGDYIMLNGQNFETSNMLIVSREIVYTGAYSPYGVPNLPNEVRKGVIRASGSILRSNLDGSDLELYAWGFRNPSYIKFDNSGRLYVSNNGFDARGSRPIANASDEFYFVTPNVWYGWPDYNAGEPITLPKFKPDGGTQPEFILKSHPNIPPIPYIKFPQYTGIMGFDFNYNSEFGPYGDIYIAEFGRMAPNKMEVFTPFSGAGHKISRIDISTRTVSTFAINKSGYPASITLEGGLERPADVAFGPDGALYILDLGLSVRNDPNVFIPNTGVIWKVTKIQNN